MGRTDGRTVRLLYASQSSFGGIKKVLRVSFEMQPQINQKCTFMSRLMILFSGIIYGGDSERFAHYSAKNLNEIGLMGEKSHSKM